MKAEQEKEMWYHSLYDELVHRYEVKGTKEYWAYESASYFISDMEEQALWYYDDHDEIAENEIKRWLEKYPDGIEPYFDDEEDIDKEAD